MHTFFKTFVWIVISVINLLKFSEWQTPATQLITLNFPLYPPQIDPHSIENNIAISSGSMKAFMQLTIKVLAHIGQLEYDLTLSASI